MVKILINFNHDCKSCEYTTIGTNKAIRLCLLCDSRLCQICTKFNYTTFDRKGGIRMCDVCYYHTFKTCELCKTSTNTVRQYTSSQSSHDIYLCDECRSKSCPQCFTAQQANNLCCYCVNINLMNITCIKCGQVGTSNKNMKDRNDNLTVKTRKDIGCGIYCDKCYREERVKFECDNCKQYDKSVNTREKYDSERLCASCTLRRTLKTGINPNPYRKKGMPKRLPSSVFPIK